MAPHRKGLVWGPGTPSEPPKGDEKVFIVSKGKTVDGQTEVRVRHADNTEQSITTRRNVPKANEPLELPKDELYDWKLLKNGKYGLVQITSTEGVPYVREPTPTEVFAALPEKDKWGHLDKLMMACSSGTAAETIDKAAAKMGIKQAQMYNILSTVDPPILPKQYTTKALAKKAAAAAAPAPAPKPAAKGKP